MFTRPWIIRFPLYRGIKEDMRLLEFKYLDLNRSMVLNQTCSTTSLPLVDPVVRHMTLSKLLKEQRIKAVPTASGRVSGTGPRNG